ncbi:hypothetical protein Acsp05_45650 [Actinokineospora sp. NBRC 105648]|nr:hypothetical protein Acsp05_45650 [Actinokineospora sp. NBRC 105648]
MRATGSEPHGYLVHISRTYLITVEIEDAQAGVPTGFGCKVSRLRQASLADCQMQNGSWGHRRGNRRRRTAQPPGR